MWVSLGRKLPPQVGQFWVAINIQTYNAERTHSGKYCYGKTPLQTFIDSAKLAYDKQLDRIPPTSEPIEAMA